MAHPSNHQEIEVKLYLASFEAVEARLRELGAVCTVERTHEHNIRYDKASESFASDGFVLRLRKDHAAKLTYKEPLSEQVMANGIHQRFEAEVTVSDFNTMHIILTRLGYSAYMTYEKYRTTYALNGAEIVLDEMPYGRFIEIEADDEPTIHTLIHKLQLDQHTLIPYSYAQLFDHVRANLGLTFTNLTFDNFAGITVPESAFSPAPNRS